MPKQYREWFLLFIAALLLSVGVWFLIGQSKNTKPIALRMTAGDASGIRHRIAQEFAKESEPFGFDIRVSETDGSESALEKLEAGEFDLALVQGGIASESMKHVEQIAPLHLEPLHLLVKPELVQSIHDKGLKQLAGHSIHRGSPGSGTFVLATKVLKFVGLDADHESSEAKYNTNKNTYSELAQLPYDALPDALMTVSTLPSPIVDRLIEEHSFQLISLDFADAFSLEAMSELGGANAGKSTLNRQHVFATIIPPFTYSVERSVPREPLNTLGTRLLLVANKRLASDTVKRLIEVLFQSRIAKAERPSIDASLLDLPTEFPMHPGAQAYRQRNKPLIAGDAVDYFEKVLAIAATVAGGVFFVFQWYRQSARRRRESSFASYMKRVIAIEQESMRNELSSHLDLASLIRLQKDLADIKAEAVTKFADGSLEGEGMIQGFLALVNDAREQLTRLILHQRENIEQLAEQQQSSPDAMWLEQARDSQSHNAD